MVGLMVKGIIEVMGLEYIDWGYSYLVDKLLDLGVMIWCEEMI